VTLSDARALDLRGRLARGRPAPLGAHWDGRGVNFAVFSLHAERVEVCLFSEDGAHELARLPLPRKTNGVFHGYLPGALPGLCYGLRAHGPYRPEQGHRFNPHKLLIDPYARLLRGALVWDDALFGYTVGESDLSFDARDSAPFVPKGVVTASAFPRERDRRPAPPPERVLIYEAHLKGLTQLHPGVRPEARGRFSGLAARPVIDHLKGLGVTSVELLPVQAFAHDRRLVDAGLRNYWGYQPLCFFAPHPEYLSEAGAWGSGLAEVQSAFAQLHAEGLEVLMDVVYNHTCEGDHRGPTLSFRGLDNAVYYRLDPREPRYYIDDSGCGNSLNATHPRVSQLILDSLRYWVEVGADGFRFDLATSLGRGRGELDLSGGVFAAALQDPALSQVRLIAEPWDLGPGGYRLGEYLPGWLEWNDTFRDAARRFWRGERGLRAELAKRVAGSSHLFRHRGRSPTASVNYVCSHDGLTLHDLVTYEERHNEDNGEGNRDGHADNLARNHGVEGETPNPLLCAARRRHQRNLLATLFLSRGTPMLLGGDELGRTQRGNNNAYCQDSPLSWTRWEGAEEEDEGLLGFVRRLSALRASSKALHRDEWLRGEPRPRAALRDLVWLTPRGDELTGDAWFAGEGRDLCFVLSDHRERLWVGMNAAPVPLECALPPVDGEGWRLCLDTADPARAPFTLGADGAPPPRVTLPPECVRVFRAKQVAAT